MALVQFNFKSKTLAQQADLAVLLPEKDEQFSHTKQHPYQVLYLLHGLADDRLGWLRYTTIENCVRNTNLAVVMPSGSHSFYSNMAYGRRYFDFITEEIPCYLGNVLPLSQERKDTFICGNSMGGYGAFKCALSRPDLYSKAVSLSGCLDIKHFVRSFRLKNFEPRNIFGEDLNIKDTDDVCYLLRHLVEKKEADPTSVQLPSLYSFCGKADALLRESRVFAQLAQGFDIDFTYDEGEGEHLWTTWTQVTPKVIHWLLEDHAAV